MSCSSSLGGDSSYDAPGARHSRRHRTRSSVRSGSSAAVLGAPGDEAIRADQQHAVRFEGMRGGSRHFSISQLHTEAIYIHQAAVHQAAALRAPQLRSTTRHWPWQAKQHEPPSVQVDGGKISQPPKVTATCGALVPGSLAVAPWAATARCPPTRRVRPTSGIPVSAHRHRPP
jgi:hypothetical protein